MGMILSRQQWKELIFWARDSGNNECCGLLLGVAPRVERATLARNVAQEPRCSFEIDPELLIEAERNARLEGPPIVGYFHSHPNGAARPSSTDAAMAAVDGRTWLIIAKDDITAWNPVYSDDGLVCFEKVRLVVEG